MTVSILGCGWLGLPLAESLLQKDFSVKGSTTTKKKLHNLKQKGITPYLIRLEPELNCENCEEFWQSELLVLNIPPGRGKENIVEYHTAQIQAVADNVRKSDIERIIFISSTSVYPKTPGVVEEEDARQGEAGRDSGEALLQAEQLLQESSEFETTIVRFGGLYGYDRNPAHYLAGKTNLNRAKAPVNLIHRDDCIQIIEEIISKDITGEVFNAVSDGHPPREMYYTTVCKALGLTPPHFKSDTGENYKVVSNAKLKKQLAYRFKFPNPLDNK